MPQTLQYPRPLNPRQINTEQDGYHCRVIVPPVPSLWRLPRCYKINFALLMLFTAYQLTPLIIHARGSLPNLSGFAGMLIVDSILYFALFGMAYLRTHRWTSFEVTANRFQIFFRMFQGESLQVDLPRHDLLEVKFNRFNGKLIVRMQGRDRREFFISGNMEVTRNVVDQLRAALELNLQSLPNAPEITPADRLIAAAGHGWVLTGIGVVTVALLAAMFLWPLAGLVLLAIGVAMSIPLGILMGTQEKDFYP